MFRGGIHMKIRRNLWKKGLGCEQSYIVEGWRVGWLFTGEGGERSAIY